MTIDSSSNGENEAESADGGTACDAAKSDAGYTVGYGRPPKEFWFRPGKSGNPKGRPKKAARLRDFKQMFDEAMSEKCTITKSGEKITSTMAEAGFMHLARQHAQGDRHARREVIGLAEKLGSILMSGQRKTIRDGSAETERPSPAYTLTEEFFDRLSPSTREELISVAEKLQAEKQNSNTTH